MEYKIGRYNIHKKPDGKNFNSMAFYADRRNVEDLGRIKKMELI